MHQCTTTIKIAGKHLEKFSKKNRRDFLLALILMSAFCCRTLFHAKTLTQWGEKGKNKSDTPLSMWFCCVINVAFCLLLKKKKNNFWKNNKKC
jgi:lipid-A-disaccharide synthase-like uncharacterized protein